MKASRFSDAQKAFNLKPGSDGMPAANICRKAGSRRVPTSEAEPARGPCCSSGRMKGHRITDAFDPQLEVGFLATAGGNDAARPPVWLRGPAILKRTEEAAPSKTAWWRSTDALVVPREHGPPV